MDQKQKNYLRLGQKLAYLLRHDQNYKFSEDGWRLTSDLTDNHDFTLEELMFIVANDNKQRFEWSDTLTYSYIRAVQGHSVNVDLHYPAVEPPQFLYHGTSEKYLNSILTEGLKKMKRLHVHLSEDPITAFKCGARRKRKRGISDAVVLRIKAKEMWIDTDAKFYKSKNGVWLTEKVPVKYLEIYTS